MTLGDLLDELRQNILHDKSDRIAGGADDLWTDSTLVRYIDEAQRRFARRALVIRDGTTSAVTEVTLAANQNEYPLHEAVIAVISARYVGDMADLARAGHSAFDTYRQPDSYYFDPSVLSVLSPGKPVAFGTDEYLSADSSGSTSVVTLRVYPNVSADYAGNTLKLRTLRMPVSRLTIDNLDAVPEIPEDHHLEMLDWAAYLALRGVDVDLGMPTVADMFKKTFEEHVKVARNHVMRKLFASMQWGFGRNGFTWEK